MPRHQIAALLCVPAVCVLAGLVHLEGRSYRRTLLKTRHDDLLARLIAPAEARPPAGPSLAAPIAAPARPIPPPGPAIEPPAPQPTASTAPPSLPPPRPEPSPPRPSPPSPPRFVLPRDLLAMSRQDEDRVGRALDRYLLSKHRTVDDSGLRRRLFEAVRPLFGARRRAEVAEYHYRILDSDRIGAFSQFGGYVYINRGVFDLVANDVELQFVLAREIAHVDAQSCAELVAQDDATDDPDPLARIVRLLAAGLPEEAEFQADTWAYRQMIRLGHSPHQSLGFLRRYLGYEEQRQALEQPDPAAADRAPGLEDHWRTLPPAVDRLEKLRAFRGP